MWWNKCEIFKNRIYLLQKVIDKNYEWSRLDFSKKTDKVSQGSKGAKSREGPDFSNGGSVQVQNLIKHVTSQNRAKSFRMPQLP